MTTRREQLRPEVRARTILAGCAHVRLTPRGDAPSDAACTGHVGILLDGAGSAYLVLAPDGRAPQGHFRITCRAAVPGLGVLRLEGRCGDTVCLATQPAVADLLTLHRESWEASPELGSDAGADDLIVVSVDLEQVTVLTPATDTQRAGVVPVDLDAYSAARPDWWLLEVEHAQELLERDHQDELLALVGGRPEVENVTPLAVSVRSMAPCHLELACLSMDGVTSMTIPFGDAMEHPSLVGQWVSRAARRVA